MTVEWLMRLFLPNSNSNDNNNNNQNNFNFLPNTKLFPTPESPILNGGSNNHNYFPSDYSGSDFKDGQVNLPVISPDYPAFFILILLVTLTSFALFILIFLCCLDGKDLADEEQGNFPVLASSSDEPEPEPLVKDVATETDPPVPDVPDSLGSIDTESIQTEEVVAIENEVEATATDNSGDKDS